MAKWEVLLSKQQNPICKTQTNRKFKFPVSINNQYDLEDRTLHFAKNVRSFIKSVPKNICNIEDCKQLAKSSGSVGANYIEANESLSRKDFKMRIKISRKESKESRFWLNLIDTQNDDELDNNREQLAQEATELLKIFSSILVNSK